MSDDDFLKLLESSLADMTLGGQNLIAQPAAPPTGKSVANIRGAPVGGANAGKPDRSTAMPSAAAATSSAAVKSGAALGLLLYVGSDFETKMFFDSTFNDLFDIRTTLDLAEIKSMIVGGVLKLLVFDATAAVKPGIAITRYIKEKALPVTVVHINSALTDNSEEYAKYKLYHLHLQPDLAARASELAMLSPQIRKKFSS